MTMGKMKLIQLTSLSILFRMVLGNDILPDITSEYSTESLSTATVLEESELAIATPISNAFPTEYPKWKSLPTLTVDKITQDIEISSAVPETSLLGKTISNLPKTEIVYQNTTDSLIELETESFPNSDKSTHHDTISTTQYAVSQDMSAEIPDTTANNFLDKSTLSVGLISKNTDRAIFDDVLISIKSSENEELDNQAILNSTNSSIPMEVEQEGTGTSNIINSTDSTQHVPKRAKSEDKYEIKNVDYLTTKKIEHNDKKYSIDDGIHTTSNGKTEKDFINSSTAYMSDKTTTETDTLFFLINKKEMPIKQQDVLNTSDTTKKIEIGNEKSNTFPVEITEFVSEFGNISADTTETNTNSTRHPKTFYGEKSSYSFGSVRPIHSDSGHTHTDTGYARPDLIDRVRPLHPDPVQSFSYYRPTPDSRIPVVADKDNTRPPRPDSDYQRVSFRPNYGFPKSTQDDASPYKSTPVSEEITAKSYRPSFRPYQSQSSFGRPYRPDYHRPASKPSEESPITPKSTTDLKGISGQSYDVSEFSRADYDYTRLSESSAASSFQPDSRPSHLKPDITETYRPSYDSKLNIYNKPTSLSDSRLTKPDSVTVKPSVFYPRPGFGSNYQTSGTAVRPFSVGTVIAAQNLTRVEFITADCFDNHMKVTMRFNGTFSGLIYSSGYAQDTSCSYVNGSGRHNYEFFIRLNRCGTIGQQEVAGDKRRSEQRRREERAQYLVNTITVQYNPVIEEDVDEHFRVTCEYGYDFWKTVTFPMLNVESPAVKVRTGSPVVFTLPPPQCNMEIRRGYGLTGSRVSGPVNVGDPLTLVIHMKSESTGFDILVSNCYAHNGGQKRLQLIDSNGCVAEEQIVSDFRGVKGSERRQQITLYSFLKAFRFTGSPALYIECDVHMCHGTCPPQRCHWRKLFKRSADEEDITSTPDSLMSESISLFQALEVRHEEADKPNLLALRNSSAADSDDVLCLRTGGFAAMLACILLLLVLTTSAAVCMCLRMRKMKRFTEETPDTKHFVEFVSHDSFK